MDQHAPLGISDGPSARRVAKSPLALAPLLSPTRRPPGRGRERYSVHGEIAAIAQGGYSSGCFAGLKRSELKQFGEYRTQRYVLHAYDQLARGEMPDLEGV
ncbi:MAG: hypothetical protein IT301_08115 [Dehalococcoidia bacterium]|nr:hypothetical protein [Dehalococcoidia bacterium]